MPKSRHKVLFVTIVPSPYQRDLFAALHAREDVHIDVCYLEGSTPENPWPEKPLQNYERVLTGVTLPLGSLRVHINVPPSALSAYDLIILCSFTSLTGQWLMNVGLRNRPWLFWGELLHRN